jgi:CDGSH-type Zn-finger protein
MNYGTMAGLTGPREGLGRQRYGLCRAVESENRSDGDHQSIHGESGKQASSKDHRTVFALRPREGERAAGK